jgi:hypothetical protein
VRPSAGNMVICCKSWLGMKPGATATEYYGLFLDLFKELLSIA